MRLTFLTCLCVAVLAPAAEKPISQPWAYAEAMKTVAQKFTGKAGVVIHVGDSITYANPYSSWAKAGEGKTPADLTVLKWMHAGAKNETDGWHLASFDHPEGGRSYTACSGIRLDELLRGGKNKMPSLDGLLKQYTPQAVVLMIGTNDASGDRRPKEFLADYAVAIETILGRHAVPIITTIPPHVNKFHTAKEYNDGIRKLAEKHQLPLIDLEAEMLTRRPDDWNGTLMNQGDVHPRAEYNGTKAISPPTKENLKNSGYLLRGWVTVQKIAEVKASVFDHVVTGKGANPAAPKDTPPLGKATRLPVTRDTWISSVSQERDGSNGGAGKLKLKAYQEFSIVDVDAKPLTGHRIHAAFLHVKLAGPERLHRVGVSSLAAEWTEGKASNYAQENGASTFRHRAHPDQPWATGASDICSVMFAEGGTIWGHAEASEPDADGWQRIPVNLDVIRAKIAGVSTGFVLFDDTGSEWTRDGDQFHFRLFPNRYIHSKDSNAKNAPWFEVYIGDVDMSKPPTPANVTTTTTGLPAGEAIITWSYPKTATAIFVGEEIRINRQPLPRAMHPSPLGASRRLHLRDLALKPGEAVNLEITPISQTGQRGETVAAQVTVSAAGMKPIPGETPTFSTEVAALPQLGKTTIAIIDEADKINPLTGELTPNQPATYLAANHLWNAKANRLTLAGSRAEFLAFQVFIDGACSKVKPLLRIPKIPNLDVQFTQSHTVETKNGPQYDPLLPIHGSFDVPASPLKPKELFGSLHAEFWIPRETPPGIYPGVLSLSTAESTLEIPVQLTVWNFTMPDKLHFLADMNGYGLPGVEQAYYRLAHRHRTVLNIVPYSQRGIVHDGYAPEIVDGKLDFTKWDRRFGSLFDGTAFDDLPRKGVPLECFYLPMHENWPMPINEHYNGSYWANEAFTKEYRAGFVEVNRQFAEHLVAKKWNNTMFQCFLNNKVDFKRNGWNRASSPWLLDEPASFQDFAALDYFANAMRDGLKLVPELKPGQFVFRADISRPMWQRDTLNETLGYNVVNADWRAYQRMLLDRKRQSQSPQWLIEYGSANAIESSNVQPIAWSIDAWTLGADGVLPWLVIGTPNAWKTGEATCLFYPPRGAEKEPTPSIRLKSFRRGQQDVEYLIAMQRQLGNQRDAMGPLVRQLLPLTAKKQGTGAAGEDAGVLNYGTLKPQELWAVRTRIATQLQSAGQ